LLVDVRGYLFAFRRPGYLELLSHVVVVAHCRNSTVLVVVTVIQYWFRSCHVSSTDWCHSCCWSADVDFYYRV